MQRNNNCYNLKKSISLILLFVIYSFIYFYNQKRKHKLKTKFLKLPCFQRIIINNYLPNISSKYIYEKEKEIIKLISLLSLFNFSQIHNNTLKSELKQKLLKELQEKKQNKNISEIKSVYVDKSFRFGNSMSLLNNLLYYCEILNINLIKILIMHNHLYAFIKVY